MFRQFFAQAPELKSAREIGLMREAGKLVAEALRICREMAKPGMRTIEIDRAVEAHYKKYGATPLFKGYPGANPKSPFPACTCISLNEQVVHGIPSQRELRDGDLLKLDTACKLNGWCADRAISVLVGNGRPERKRLIDAGEHVLKIAMEELPRRKWWSEVALSMQRYAHQSGYTVVEDYVGHGIGRIMHESPQVPNYVPRGRAELRKMDFRLEPGLVLAVEPMLNMGKAETRVLADQWTVVTKDGLPSVHVEHTLALTAEGVIVITADS